MALRDYLPPWRPSTPATLPPSNLAGAPRNVSAREIGTSGTENFGGYIRREDYNPEFDDFQKATATYDKMRRTDATVRAMLQVIKLPLRGATWQCNAATSDPVDQQIADFCNKAIFDDDSMQDSWDFTLRHILLQLDFGVSVLEKVWRVDEDGYYRFKRLAPRLPKTLREWHVDREGKLVAIVQYAAVPYGNAGRNPDGSQRLVRYGSTVSYQYLTIPAEYCAVFCLEREGDNYEGSSLLRNIYRNWWFKDQAYHVMGVGLDRWGVGIPIAELEEGHGLTTADRETLKGILQSVRSNEKAYMVMPEHVKFKIEPSGSGQGTQGSFGIQWIDHNDAQMARNVLASFLTMGRDNVGTLGFGSRLTDLFVSSLDGIAAGIAGDIKTSLVKPLCDLNFDMSRRQYPTPVCLDLEQVDLNALVEIMAKLSGTLVTPQDSDENTLRKMIGLQPLAPHLTRAAQTTKSKPKGDASAGPGFQTPGA
jgi:hypothetical protein